MQMLKKFLFLKKILSHPFKCMNPKYVRSRFIGMHTIQGLLVYKSAEQQAPQVSLFGGKHFGLIVIQRSLYLCSGILSVLMIHTKKHVSGSL